MSEEFTIRRVNREANDAWLAMRQALWPECPHDEQVAGMAEIIADENEAAFVAVSPAGEPLGFVEASIRPWVDWCDTRPVGYVEGWYVRPEFRRRGVGRALVAAAEQWAADRGCVEMASDAYVSNIVSQQAHVAVGFEQHESVVRFRKRL